jgi:PAS domain S-box-containing protein
MAFILLLKMLGTQHLLHAFMASRNPCFIFSANPPEFTILAVSQPMLTALACDEKDLLNKSLEALTSSQPGIKAMCDHSSLVQSLTTVATTGKKQSEPIWFPSFLQRGDFPGVHAWQSENIPLLHEKGSTEYILHSVTEVSLEALLQTNETQIPEHLQQEIERLPLKRAYHETNAILESIGEAYFRVDENFTVIYWNNQAEILLRTRREDVLHRNLWETFPQAVGTVFYENYQAALKEARVIRFETSYGLHNRWFEVSAFPTSNGLSVYLKDITDKKRAADNIRDSEEKNRLVMNAALDAIICIDKNGDVTFWNPQATSIFGWQSEEVIGKQLSTFIIPDRFRHMHDDGIARYLKTGEDRALNRILELHALKRSGEEFPIELTVIPIKQPNEEFFCAFLRDISARKKAEQNIRDSNERFEKVSQATNDAIWDWDILQNTLYRGPGFHALFGYEIDNKLQGKDFSNDSFHPEDIVALQDSLNQCIDDRLANHWQLEYRIIRADGKICSVADRGIVIRNEEGEATRMVGAMSDITYRKEYEESLKKLNQTLEEQARDLVISNKELEQFAYVASHDLQEPLRMVTSFLKQLENRYSDIIDDRGKKYIHFAVDGAQRMRQIILDLLEFSRVGRGEDRLELVDTGIVAREAINLYINQIDESGATVDLQSLPTVQTCRIPLAQVFQNLISNALKYRRAGIAPKIVISALETDSTWQFRVKDNGIGIEQEYHDRIFIIFQRLHNKDEFSGTGLGLAIVKKIINNLGGKIWVESEEGHGTSFYFTLPKSES